MTGKPVIYAVIDSCFSTSNPFSFMDLQLGTMELENVQAYFFMRNDLIARLIDHL